MCLSRRVSQANSCRRHQSVHELDLGQSCILPSSLFILSPDIVRTIERRNSQEAVVSNKDLDLPTQQELLAQFRCDEIASTSFKLFAETIATTIPPSQGTGKIVQGLGELMAKSIKVALGKAPLPGFSSVVS